MPAVIRTKSTIAPIRKKIGQASADGRWRATVHGRGDSAGDLLGYRRAHDRFPADGAVGSLSAERDGTRNVCALTWNAHG